MSKQKETAKHLKAAARAMDKAKDALNNVDLRTIPRGEKREMVKELRAVLGGDAQELGDLADTLTD